MINYGILSTARIVKRFIAGIRESKDGNVYAIASRDVSKAKQAASEYGIEKYYGNYLDLIKDENVDVVYIPTTNSTHYQYAKLALENHKNVILEKPFTINSKEAYELFEIAEKNNCFLMEGQKSLFLPATLKVKELIDNGVIGKVEYIDVLMSHPASHPQGHWMYDLNQGGGALNGSGSYPIEYCCYLLNKTDFSCQASFIKGEGTADNLASFQLFDEELIINCTLSMNTVLENRIIIFGTLGKIIVNNYWKADKLLLVKDNKETEFNYPFNSEFVYEVEHINKSIENNLLTSPIVSKDITCKCVEYIEKMYKSFE